MIESGIDTNAEPAPQAGEPDGRTAKTRLVLIVMSVVAVLGIGFASWAEVESKSQWNPLLAPYAEFVEQERGLEFKRTVGVARFNPSTSSDILVDPSFPPERVTATELLGLARPDLALGEEPPDEFSTFLGAAYDPLRVEIRIPKGVPEEALSPVIVHELTHALQSQHGMNPLQSIDPFSDGFTLWRMLLEGDATRIEHAYYAQFTTEQRDAFYAAGGYQITGYRDPSWHAPAYTIGEPVVRAVIARDGQEAFDELLRSAAANLDSTSSSPAVDMVFGGVSAIDAAEQIVLPDGAESADGEIGAFGWFVALAPLAGTDAAFDAVIGYDSDAYAVFDDSCARYAVFFDSSGDAGEFAVVIEPLGVAVDQGDDSVSFDLCEPLGVGGSESPAVAFPLVVAQQLSVHHLRNGLSADVARCAALAQARTVPPDLSLDNFEGYDRYFGESTAFVDECR